jgi:acyl carrier protein
MTDAEKVAFVVNAVKHLFKRQVTVGMDDALLDLGLDSLDVVELQMYYEDVTGFDIDPDVTVKTVADLVALMK